jgi:hypothetical protein
MTSTEQAAASSVLAMLNAERQANHLPALGASSALTTSARRHNLAMAGSNTMSHQVPGEPPMGTRMTLAGVVWYHAAENIGWTTDRTTAGARGLEQTMYDEKPPDDGHRTNILSTAVSWVGIDVYIDANTQKLWLTEDFADAAGPPAVVVCSSALVGPPSLTYAYIAPVRAGGAMYVNGLVKQNCTTGITRSANRITYLQRQINGQWQNVLWRSTRSDGTLAVGFMQSRTMLYRLVVIKTDRSTEGRSEAIAR